MPSVWLCNWFAVDAKDRTRRNPFRFAGLDWKGAVLSIAWFKQKSFEVDLQLRPDMASLQLLVELNGIQSADDCKTCSKRHGQTMPLLWLKVYRGIRSDFSHYSAVEATGDQVLDAIALPEPGCFVASDQSHRGANLDGKRDTRALKAKITDYHRFAQVCAPECARPQRESTLGRKASTEKVNATRRYGRPIPTPPNGCRLTQSTRQTWGRNGAT